MADSMLSTQNLSENFDVIGWLKSFGEVKSAQESEHSFGIEDFEAFYSSLCRSDGQDTQQNVLANMVSQPMESMDQGCYLPELCTTSVDAMGILQNHYCGSKKISDPHLHRDVTNENVSVADVLRLAGERYLQFSSQRVDGLAMFIHPYGSAFSELSLQKTKEVELMHTLFVAADNVASFQFDVASELLRRCSSMASRTGNPVERLVFYFSESLQDRINGGTGRTVAARTKERIQRAKVIGLGDQPEFIAMQRGLPFSQVMQIVGIQAIVEDVKNASKIHLIDLEIRTGVQWTALLQALSNRKGSKLEVKITALGTSNRENIEATGKRLLSYAGSLNLPLSFNVVFISDMSDIKTEHFSTEVDETVAVYGSTILRTMISRPDCLDNLMKVIRSLKPSIMVVGEVEANHNSPSFLHRFVESLFFYGAVFDCIDDCMERGDRVRLTLERSQFGEGIQNTIVSEGEERVNRNVKLDVWRAFFKRFWMEEIELSETSVLHANLVKEQFAKGDSCSVNRNGKGIIVGWKGTPLLSLTTWKFSRFNPC